MSQKITKRPLSAFMFFMQEYRKINKGNSSSIGETAKDAAAQWKSISDIDRKKFQDMANNDKKRYEADLASGMVVASKKSKKIISRRTNSKRYKDPNAPKKTKTAYMCYLGEFRKNSTLSGAKLISKAAEQWKLLNENDKEKYIKMSVEDKKRYENELDNYRKSNASATSKNIGIKSKPTNTKITSSTKNNTTTIKKSRQQSNINDDIHSDLSSNNDISTSNNEEDDDDDENESISD